MRGVWIRKPNRATSVVFVHGILSSGEECWENENGSYWPTILKKESDLEDVGIYVYTYHTAIFSGSYRLSDIVDDLKERLRIDGVLKSGCIIFVCHSMGGIVVRKFIVERATELVESKTDCGLFLVASPSLGSSYANWLRPIAKLFGHAQADALRFTENNAWLNDLDKDFRNLKEGKRLNIFGKELIEDKFILIKRWFRKQVVARISGVRYFGEEYKVPESDHFSIAKPENADAMQHRLLCEFIRTALQQRTSDGLDSSIGFEDTHKYGIGLVDEFIAKRLNTIRKSRFFSGVDLLRQNRSFADALLTGYLSGASVSARANALAWLARLLSTKDLTKARECHAEAEGHADFPLAVVAEAFILSSEKEKAKALSCLSSVSSSIARTAGLQIVRLHDGDQAALEWLSVAKIDENDLDADGKFVFAVMLLASEKWEAVQGLVEKFEDSDLEESPALLFISAMVHLCSVVPSELRGNIVNQVPLEARNFPLASSPEAMIARSKATEYFERCADTARQFNGDQAAGIASDYSLWLRLRDANTSDDAREDLLSSMRDRVSGLRRLPLAINFGLEIDIAAAEQRVEQDIALAGEVSSNAAAARFSISLSQKKPVDAANYIEQHIDEILTHLDPVSVRSIQIDLLTQGGAKSEAEDKLALIKDKLSPTQLANLTAIVGASTDEDPVDQARAEFKRTDGLGQLARLVDMLEESRRWQDMLPFARDLHARTNSIEHANAYGVALTNAGEHAQLQEFLTGDAADVVDQSLTLRSLRALTLFKEGNLSESRTIIESVRKERDSPSDRDLYVNQIIYSGDWDELLSHIEAEWVERELRSPDELLRLGQLGLLVKSPRSWEIITLAANSTDDPNILAAAYFASTNAGWEQSEEAGQWFRKATAASNGEGPLKRVSMKEIAAEAPRWQAAESEIFDKLKKGELFMAGAARAANRTLTSLTLFPAMLNNRTNDVRRRSPIFSFSHRKLVEELAARDSVAIEPCALYVLSQIDLLDSLFDVFQKVVLPHSSMAWMFEEKQRTAAHQVSRVKRAQDLVHMTQNGRLHPVALDAGSHVVLADDVGADLAAMIGKAQGDSADTGISSLVVRSGPVTRSGSWMEEEVDLSAYSDVLCDCSAVVEALKRLGEITSSEERIALNYLSVHEVRWPTQPRIERGATLYLDELSIVYLYDCDVLNKLADAGFHIFVMEAAAKEASDLILSAEAIKKVEEGMEQVRIWCKEKLISGEAVLAPQSKAFPGEDETTNQNPSVEACLIHGVDAILYDDRFFNTHRATDTAGQSTPVLSTINFLTYLHSLGTIDDTQHYSYLHKLRTAGHILVPITAEELVVRLKSCTIEKGVLQETAETRAIREYLERIRMDDLLRVPTDVPWLADLIQQAQFAIQSIWRSDISGEAAAVYSDWLLGIGNPADWSRYLSGGEDLSAYGVARRLHCTSLLVSSETESSRRDEYFEWLEASSVWPDPTSEPELFAWLLEESKRVVLVAVDGLAQEVVDDSG